MESNLLSSHPHTHYKNNRSAATRHFCFICEKSICGNEYWRTHFREHIASRDHFCGRITHNGVVLWPGLCPFCLGCEDLLVESRLQQWTGVEQLLTHMAEHLCEVRRWPLECPHPKCVVSCDNHEYFWEHMSSDHGLSSTYCPPNSPVLAPGSSVKMGTRGPACVSCGRFSQDSLSGDGKESHVMKRLMIALETQLSNNCDTLQPPVEETQHIVRGRSEPYRCEEIVRPKRNRSSFTEGSSSPLSKRPRSTLEKGLRIHSMYV